MTFQSLEAKMNNFKLNDSSNKNKVFLVNRSEIEGRLDPNFYIDLYRENEIKVMNSPFVTKSLSDITTTISDGTHFTPQYQSTGIKFISVKDVRKSALDLNHPVYISVEEAEKLDKRCKPQKNDILLTKIGATYGYAAVVDSDDRFQIFVSLALIRPDDKIVNPYYLEICLNSEFAYLQFQRNLKGAGVPDLHLEEIRKLKLPVPSLDIQNEIVEKYSYALKKSRGKQSQSKTLLKSIDSYLLNELGIELPKNDNSLKTRIFTTKFSAVCGGRLDPLYMVSANILHSRKYSQQKLSEVCSYFSSGFGAGKEDQKNAIDGIIQIRPTNIDENCDLKFDKNIYVDEHQNISKIEKTDVLFNNTNSQELVGKTALGELAEGMYYSNHITVIKTIQSELNPLFLKETLNLLQREKVFFSICTNWNNQSGVGLDLLKTISIPLPPLSKQIEIAEHIKEIRSQAKQLEIESEQILLDAKKEIEKMILGE